jgi:glycogen(starch) synthase
MTILMTADCIGGVWTYSLDLIRALPQYHFVVATMGALPSEAQRATISQLHNATLCASPWKLEWMDNPWEDVRQAGQWLLELERQFSPDLNHLNGYSHAALPFKAPKLVVAHSCVLSWWRAVKGEDAPSQWTCYQEHVANGLRQADLVVSPTQALLQELQQIYGSIAAATVIWNGSTPQHTIKSQPQPIILAAGRLWDEAKNIRLLDTVASHLHVPIRVAGAPGDGDLPTSHLDMLGFLDPAEMSQQMQNAAIWAHPARYEPFGLAVLEAANRDCALVLSDIPTLRELWDEAAIFVAPDDENGWVEALQHLLEDPQQCAEWAAKSKARSALYSLERFGTEYERTYQELVVRH